MKLRAIPKTTRPGQSSAKMNDDCAKIAPLIIAICNKHGVVPRTVCRVAMAHIEGVGA
ncbi:MAG: hypothetical protein ACRCY3_14440 [Sphingorhabdus sp.]